MFMVGMEEGLLPHSRSMDDPTQLEEERRLCYVGVTRAKERLYLLRAFRRGFRGGSEPGMPSRFLLDIPQELLAAPAQSKRAGASSQRSAVMRGDSGADAQTTSTETRRESIRRTRLPTPPRSDSRGRSAGGMRVRAGGRAPNVPGQRPVRGVESRAGSRPQPAASPHLATGDKVTHKVFGEGIVMECKPSGNDFEVTVAFRDGAGVKRLLLGMAPIEKAN